MDESLTQQRRVGDEGLRIVKPCRQGRRYGIEYFLCLTVPGEEAPANSVPAAAVIQRGQALFGIIGRKGRVGGFVSRMCNPRAQPGNCIRDCETRVLERVAEFHV